VANRTIRAPEVREAEKPDLQLRVLAEEIPHVLHSNHAELCRHRRPNRADAALEIGALALDRLREP
jgi:hypothetical protein